MESFKQSMKMTLYFYEKEPKIYFKSKTKTNLLKNNTTNKPKLHNNAYLNFGEVMGNSLQRKVHPVVFNKFL